MKTDTTFNYPVMINGRMKMNFSFDVDAEQSTVVEALEANDDFKSIVNDKPIKTFVFVKGKMINAVI